MPFTIATLSAGAGGRGRQTLAGTRQFPAGRLGSGRLDGAAYLDPLGLGLVLGGALLAAAVRSTLGDLGAACRALGPLLTADPARDGEAAHVAVGRIERLAEVRHLSCADRIDTTQAFLRRAARRLSDARDAQGFAQWGEGELAARAARHGAVQAVWRAIADAAPGMGLIGTILGLIAMFRAMDDPARIGPAMALALMTTLYGAILSNLIAGPIAARLERLSAAEREWQARTIAKLVRLAEAELPARPHLRSVA